ncbi:hypothetical protein RB195_025407 [Necator americanus]|uniref:Reverse transcriptase domain-containing protein n=1 Tax=Necator americanus TaxID=51031 RepID=A0ABR1ES61_NECAM
MQLAFLDFEAAFDSPHQGRLLNALRADGVPGKFVHLLDDINQRTTAAVQTPAVCTTPFDVLQVYPFVIRPVMMYESETSPAPPTTVAKIDSNGSELLKRLLGYFSPRETNRSPCSTCFEQFVGFKLQDATRSKEEVLN